MAPRRACRKDANHDIIADAFRVHGCDWVDTWQYAQYTPGFPDGIVRYGRVVRFIEVKTPGAKLTPDEEIFRALHEDVYRVVATLEDVHDVLGEIVDDRKCR